MGLQSVAACKFTWIHWAPLHEGASVPGQPFGVHLGAESGAISIEIRLKCVKSGCVLGLASFISFGKCVKLKRFQYGP